MNHVEKKDKQLIFISHITEEKTIAIEIKNLIETAFERKVEIFVSSDDVSTPLGKDWLSSVSDSLKNCKAILIICSIVSIDKPWINIEFGAGWVREIPIIPICHSGMTPSKLPLPLKLQRGINTTKKDDLDLLVSTIEKSLKIKKRTVDYSKFIEKIKEFEEEYTFWDVINNSFNKIAKINTDIIRAVKQCQGKNILIKIRESDIRPLKILFKPLEEKNVLKFGIASGKGTSTIFSTQGSFIDCLIVVLPEFNRVILSNKFVFY